jgi:hypothetical protein
VELTDAEAHTGLGYVRARQKAASAARREASLALAYNADYNGVLHNVACIYGELAKAGAANARADQDAALSLLRRALVQWWQGGSEHDEPGEIRREAKGAFSGLKDRPEFQQLLNGF